MSKPLSVSSSSCEHPTCFTLPTPTCAHQHACLLWCVLSSACRASFCLHFLPARHACHMDDIGSAWPGCVALCLPTYLLSTLLCCLLSFSSSLTFFLFYFLIGIWVFGFFRVPACPLFSMPAAPPRLPSLCTPSPCGLHALLLCSPHPPPHATPACLHLQLPPCLAAFSSSLLPCLGGTGWVGGHATTPASLGTSSGEVEWSGVGGSGRA